jgi:RNA polymerase sigma-70 factor (ECF subfamily)
MFFVFLAYEAEDGEIKFESLYNRWKKLMLSKAAAILHDRDLAQDAVSEAFIRVYKNLRKLDDVDSGKTAAFLVMIVKNVALTMYQKQSKIITADITAFDQADSYDLEDTVMAENNMSQLLASIDSLKEDLKAPFLLKYAYDYSLKDISRLLKISESNAAVRIHRAKGRLAKILREEGAEK